MQLESWEREPKERIDACLNCTVPPELCHGAADCSKRTQRRRGQIPYEVTKLVKKGWSERRISAYMHLRKETIKTTIRRLEKEGAITHEEAETARRSPMEPQK